MKEVCVTENPKSDLLRVNQFADAGNVKESTVRRWLLEKRLAFVRFGRRAIRIPRSEVDRLIREGSVPAQDRRNLGGRQSGCQKLSSVLRTNRRDDANSAS